MKIKKFLIFLLISTITFTEVPKAIPPVSNTYKQGIYDITDIKEVKATAEFLTPNNATNLIIFNSNGYQTFYKRFDTVNEVVHLGTIKDDDIVVIIGKGEIAITISYVDVH
ncbi:hypothetical protein UT300005_10480 [Clostridium sp. CTA-5]